MQGSRMKHEGVRTGRGPRILSGRDQSKDKSSCFGKYQSFIRHTLVLAQEATQQELERE